MARRFRYAADPVCLTAIAAYLLNRAVLAPLCADALPFLRTHFADLLLVPAALPLLLWLQRRAGLRTHDAPPTPGEIASVTALWAVLFEAVLPALLGRGISDPLDVIAYAVGALVAALMWSRASAVKANAPLHVAHLVGR